jgi:hypothetical protein
MTIPNLFIIGGPKCGTTALAHYLSEHPDIYFSKFKEPAYFCTDIADGLRQYRDFSRYIQLFEGSESFKFKSEGSTYYLMSKTAIDNILSLNPHAKFVACIRNPIEQTISYHRQQLNNIQEDVEDFEMAWSLQFSRAKGMNVPSICYDKKILIYGEVASLGKQLDRFFNKVQPNQRHIIVFDDLKAKPSIVYADLLKFLEIDHDGRSTFPIINEAYSYAFPSAMKILRYQPPFLTSLAAILRRLNKDRPIGLYRWVWTVLDRKTRQPRHNPPISAELRKEMIEYFCSDVKLLSELINRNLITMWGFDQS